MQFCYKGKHFDTIYAFACKEAKGHVNKEDIENLISHSKESVGIYNHSDELLIKQLSSLILLLEEQKKELIKEMKENNYKAWLYLLPAHSG